MRSGEMNNLKRRHRGATGPTRPKLILAALPILCACCSSRSFSYPSQLSHHWVCSQNEKTRGLWLKGDGTGKLEGSDPTWAGPPIKWRVVNGSLEILELGDEGEHSNYVSFSHRIKGSELVLSPEINGCQRFERLGTQ